VLTTTAILSIRPGLMRRDQSPNKTRSQGVQIGRPSAGPIEDDELMFECHRFGEQTSGTTGADELRQTGDHVDKQDE
jgi:hypothetical protein